MTKFPKKENPRVIGEEIFIFESPDGTRTTGRIFIGEPYEYGKHLWCCPVQIEGAEMLERLIEGDIGGASSFHSILMAMKLLKRFLENFVEAGGRVLHRDESDCDIDNYFSLS